MAFKFTPKPESELSSGFENLPPGRYPFTVLESGIAISKSKKNPGREMVGIKLNVHGPNSDRHVYDYFADWFSEWKLKHFLEVVGRARWYIAGEVDPSGNAWAQLQGFVEIDEEADNTGKMKNVVVDYLPKPEQKVEALGAAPQPERKGAPAPAPSANPPEEDDVPF